MLLRGMDENTIAYQVAGLINDNNGLNSPKYTHHILDSTVNYVVETHGNLVLGAVALDKQSFTFSEIRHLVVRTEWRGKGLAKFIVNRAMQICQTKMVYATVREGNEASLYLFKSLGFMESGSYPTEDHDVLLLVRATPEWEKKIPSWKSSLLSETIGG